MKYSKFNPFVQTKWFLINWYAVTPLFSLRKLFLIYLHFIQTNLLTRTAFKQIVS